MDHHTGGRCGPQLVGLALRDPVPAVRGGAARALKCQPCKPRSLVFDATPRLIEVV
jgi:hypothetical protein